MGGDAALRKRRHVEWLARHKYPEGFQLLCWNCNCGRAINGGICPHEEV